MNLTSNELEIRIKRLCTAITEVRPDWDTALIISRVNQYYFTGTMQDGLLVIKKDGTLKFFARRTYERAVLESPLSDYVYPMKTYKDAVEEIGSELGNTLLEIESMTIGILERLKKHFSFKNIYPIEKMVSQVRAVKSPYELFWMKEAGNKHKYLFDEVVPAILREGMSEVDFTAELYEHMLKMGFHGVTRFYKYQTEIIVGQVAFGENSLYPTNFDGPGGMRGMHPAVPIIGDRERKLKKGDLVFLDTGFGMCGYNSDRTQVYMFGDKPSDYILKEHRKCIEIEKRMAQLLKPGNIPSNIYNNIMNELDQEFLNNFMGLGGTAVKFLGHGIGLHVDEYPVIANGFDSPLVENMVIALEPKKGIPGVGMIGVEDTYLVTPEGGECLTGGEKDIIVV